MDHNHQKPRTSKIGNGWRGHFQWKFLLNGPKIFSKYIHRSGCMYFPLDLVLSCISVFHRNLFQTFQNCIKTIPSITTVAAAGQ